MFSKGFFLQVINIQDCVVKVQLYTTQSHVLVTQMKKPTYKILT